MHASYNESQEAENGKQSILLDCFGVNMTACLLHMSLFPRCIFQVTHQAFISGLKCLEPAQNISPLNGTVLKMELLLIEICMIFPFKMLYVEMFIKQIIFQEFSWAKCLASCLASNRWNSTQSAAKVKLYRS